MTALSATFDLTNRHRCLLLTPSTLRVLLSHNRAVRRSACCAPGDPPPAEENRKDKRKSVADHGRDCQQYRQDERANIDS